MDAGPGWKGYYLAEDQDGIDIHVINGIHFSNGKAFIGLGLGYQNFKGTPGFSLFGDLSFRFLRSDLSPILHLKVGNDHIWNQYEGGTSTALVELGLGLDYKLSEKLHIYIQSGFLYTQQSKLLPLRVGIRL